MKELKASMGKYLRSGKASKIKAKDEKEEKFVNNTLKSKGNMYPEKWEKMYNQIEGKRKIL